MAFGLFSKKQPAKPEKTPVKGQKAPAKKPEAQKPAVQPVVEEEGFSLDFTHYAEPAEVAAATAAATPAPVEHKPVHKPAGLDFSSLVDGLSGDEPEAAEPEAEPVEEAPGDLGADFSQFLEKAEAIVEAQPAAPAPTPAPVAKAPPPAAPAPAPAPEVKAAPAPAPAPKPAPAPAAQPAPVVAKAPPPAPTPAAQPAPTPPAVAKAAPAPQPAAPAPVAKASPPPAAPAPAAKAPPPPAAPPAAPAQPAVAKASPAPAAKPVAQPAPAPSPAAKAAPTPTPAPKPAAAKPAAPVAKAPAPAEEAKGDAPPALDLPDLEYHPPVAPPPDRAVPAKPAEEADTVKFSALELDFSPSASQVMPVLQPTPKPAPVAKAAPAPAPAAKPAPVAPAAKAKAPGPKSVQPKGGPKSVARAAKPAKVSPAAQGEISAPNSLLIAEVESGKNEVPGVIEEAAMAFANDQAQEALDKLDKAIAGGKLESWNLPAWLMRFDLYQELGRKSEFEEKALDFVVKFERSPPAWVEPPPGSLASRPGSSAAVTLSGPLSAASAAALDQLRKAAEKQSKLRVDFSNLESVDGPGCGLLLDTLKHLNKAKKEVYISGETQIMSLLCDKAEPCNVEVPQSVWLLLLELYQALGMSEEFEEAAVDFAVTFEVSPPSWEARPRAQSFTPARPEASGVRVATDDSFRLHGEIAGQQDSLFRMLTDYANKASPVLIDFAHTHRIDFVNAGRLAGIVEKVVQHGKPVVLRSAGEMTIALFAVVGLHKLARIIPRK